MANMKEDSLETYPNGNTKYYDDGEGRITTYNEYGGMLTFDYSDGYSDGYSEIKTYDLNCNTLTYKNSKGFCEEYTRDEYGNVLTYENTEGDWSEYTYDSNGNRLTTVKNNGIWEKLKYFEHSNVIRYKNNFGLECSYFYKMAHASKTIHIRVSDYHIEITKKGIEMGCQKKTLEEWLSLTDEEWTIALGKGAIASKKLIKKKILEAIKLLDN